jgi:hypothetical protein
VTVADPGALRQRRSRAHKAGDHSLCVRCAVQRAEVPVPDGAAPVSDAEAELRALAGTLAVAYRAQPENALLARELRMTLQALLPAAGGSGVDSELEEFFAGLRA